MTVVDRTELSTAAPEKSLTVSLKKNAGRNAQGKITVRHRGGGSKRKYRIIDFKRNKDGVPATVKSIEYDPNRTANIALIAYADGQKAYILAPEGLKVGQKVTIEPQVYCGHCYPCRHGKYNLCEELKVMGFQTTGTASEYFAVDASKVTPIPEEMSYEEGAMIEPLAVAVHAVKQMGDVKGMNITVIGAGPIGNLVAQTAKGMGAAKVMITDVSDLRLAKAKECGIDICVNTKEKNFGEALVEAFGPDKADVIYDCAGNNITMGQAIQYARKGSVIVLVAVFADMATVDLAVANDHELDIKSTMMYRHEDYVDAIDLVNAGKVHLRPLISKTFKFKDYLKAYQYIDENRETTMKVIINVQEK